MKAAGRKTARRRPGAVPALPPVLLAAIAAAAALLGLAWWERRPPASGEEAEQEAVLTVVIPDDQRARLRSWEAFFVCYDLVEEDEIIELTLKRQHRGGKGSLAFPTDGRVEVELPQGRSAGITSEALLVEIDRVKRAVHARRQELRRQCRAS
jgi:hypothetical protein